MPEFRPSHHRLGKAKHLSNALKMQYQPDDTLCTCVGGHVLPRGFPPCDSRLEGPLNFTATQSDYAASLLPNYPESRFTPVVGNMLQ